MGYLLRTIKTIKTLMTAISQFVLMVVKVLIVLSVDFLESSYFPASTLGLISIGPNAGTAIPLLSTILQYGSRPAP